MCDNKRFHIEDLIEGIDFNWEEIGGIKLTRHYNLNAPKGVNGRNSDNTLIKEKLQWAPSIRLKDGLERTYAWIHDQMVTNAPCPVY